MMKKNAKEIDIDSIVRRQLDLEKGVDTILDILNGQVEEDRLKYVRIDNYLINLNKCINIHYSKVSEKNNEYVLFFEFEDCQFTSTYDGKEDLEKDLAILEELIGEENLAVL